jgi:hypothetical protein
MMGFSGQWLPPRPLWRPDGATVERVVQKMSRVTGVDDYWAVLAD